MLFFEETAGASGKAKASFNWVAGEVSRKLNDLGERFERGAHDRRRRWRARSGWSRRAPSARRLAKSVFEKMYDTGRSAEEIVSAEGLAQIGDEGALLASVAAVAGGPPDAVAQYRSGKTGTFGFLVGQVMKATGGKANPGW